MTTTKRKNPIPGFVGELPKPGSSSYPAEDIEPAICAYMIQEPRTVIPLVLERGITTEKFIDSNGAWATLFSKLVEFWEAGEEDLFLADRSLALCCKLTTLGYENLFGRKCWDVLQLWTQFLTAQVYVEVWIAMMNDRYRKEQAREKALLASMAMDCGDGEEAQQAYLEAAEVIQVDMDREKEVSGFKDMFIELVEEAELREAGELERRVISTGINLIDDLMRGGIRPGDLWIFGGATGEGKSILMLQVAGHAVRHERARVLVVSMEMTKRENLSRILAGTYGACIKTLMTDPCDWTAEDEAHAAGAYKKMNQDDPDLHITEKGTQTIQTIRALCRRYNPQILVVDYIGLLSADGNSRMNREERYVDAANKLKALAKDFECAVITACQLNEDGRIYGARAMATATTLTLSIVPGEGLSVGKVRHNRRPDKLLPLVMNGEKQRFELSGK